MKTASFAMIAAARWRAQGPDFARRAIDGLGLTPHQRFHIMFSRPRAKQP